LQLQAKLETRCPDLLRKANLQKKKPNKTQNTKTHKKNKKKTKKPNKPEKTHPPTPVIYKNPKHCAASGDLISGNQATFESFEPRDLPKLREQFVGSKPKPHSAFVARTTPFPFHTLHPKTLSVF